MVRPAFLPIVLVFLALLGSLLAPPATTQAQVDTSSPKDVVQAFLADFQGVVNCRGVPAFFIFEAKRDCEIPSDTLRSFYDTHLSARSRAHVTQEQFVRFFTENALRVTVEGRETPRTITFGVAVRATLAEPMYTESRDLALVHAVVTIEVRDYTRAEPRSVTRRDEPTVDQIVDWWSSMLTRPMSDRSSYFSSVRESKVVETLYLVIKEASAWKLVLHGPVVREMQKLPPRSDARRFAVSASASDGGLTLKAIEVTLDRPTTRLSLHLENAAGAEVSLRSPLSRATLTDEGGAEYRAQAQQRPLPERVPPRSAVQFTIAFDPVPGASKSVSLALPDIGAGERTLTLRLTIPLVSLSYPVVGQTSIPGEPVLLYLMSIVRPAVIGSSSLDESLLKDFYQRFLSRFTQGQITETDFVAHWKTKARRQWLEAFGGEQSFVFALDYAVDEPAYTEARDQARIRATITTRAGALLSARIRTDTSTFRMIRDGHMWRLEFPESVVEEMQPPRPPHVLARWFPNAAVTTGGLTVHVRQVAVERDVTGVTITIENRRDDAASLFLAMADATLTDEHGKLYHTRMLRTTVPDRIAGRSSVTAVATFEAVPVGSKRLVLTIPDIQIGNETIAITLPIPLSRP